MTILSATDLAQIRATQEAHMLDECVISRQSATANSLNEQVKSFTDDAAATKCGIDMRPGSERYGNREINLIYDASIRLPISTTITNQDRIKITKRHGEALAVSLVMYVVGPVQRGPSAIRLLLKKVEV